MNNTPKISVFTTCLNSGKYLKETINSILAQDFKDFEIKLEIEHYYQISDIIEDTDLSRVEMLLEVYWPIDDNWRVILGYESEQFKSSNNELNSSAFLSIGYNDIFSSKQFKNRFFN